MRDITKKKELKSPLNQRPKAGDGTQDEYHHKHANWFGPSVEPEAEYIDDGVSSESLQSGGQEEANTRRTQKRNP